MSFHEPSLSLFVGSFFQAKNVNGFLIIFFGEARLDFGGNVDRDPHSGIFKHSLLTLVIPIDRRE